MSETSGSLLRCQVKGLNRTRPSAHYPETVVSIKRGETKGGAQLSVKVSLSAFYAYMKEEQGDKRSILRKWPNNLYLFHVFFLIFQNTRRIFYIWGAFYLRHMVALLLRACHSADVSTYLRAASASQCCRYDWTISRSSHLCCTFLPAWQRRLTETCTIAVCVFSPLCGNDWKRSWVETGARLKKKKRGEKYNST